MCLALGLASFCSAAETADTPDAPPSWQQRVDTFFGTLNEKLIPILFFDVSFGACDPSVETVHRKLAEAEQPLPELEAAFADTKAELSQLRSQWTEAQAARGESVDRLTGEVNQAFKEYRRAKRQLDSQQRRVKTLLGWREKLQSGQRIHSIPLIVVFLLLGGVFFTFRYGLVNVRLFKHSIAVIRGKYDNPDDHGEINHFQALTSALSATVGLGNIAGVAIAISQGGAGALFWMWVVAFFGMSSKFSSCTLAQMYRRIAPEGKKSEHVLGGPMVYLADGMKDVFGRGFGTVFGKVLAITFAFFAIMGSLGGGNMFQGNQTFAIVGDVVFHQEIENEDKLIARVELGDAAAATELRQARQQAVIAKQENKRQYAWVGGLVLTILVGIVIVGGIKRIGEVTSKLVPAMCLFYVGVCLVIVLSNFGEVPDLLRDILEGAFREEAIAWGGLMGVLVVGVKRGAFSNEAGLGSAAIAHSAARTAEPVREGVVAMIGPFIDTLIVCTMTALAILITDAHRSGSAGSFSNEGVGITASAFSTLAPQLTILLTFAVFIFAYSTMISWSYYGERASEYLFGRGGIWPYRAVFLLFVFIAPMISLDNVITFTDLLILSMAYPNILGMLILSSRVARRKNEYLNRLRRGEMKPYIKTPDDPAAQI